MKLEILKTKIGNHLEVIDAKFKEFKKCNNKKEKLKEIEREIDKLESGLDFDLLAHDKELIEDMVVPEEESSNAREDLNSCLGVIRRQLSTTAYGEMSRVKRDDKEKFGMALKWYCTEKINLARNGIKEWCDEMVKPDVVDNSQEGLKIKERMDETAKPDVVDNLQEGLKKQKNIFEKIVDAFKVLVEIFNVGKKNKKENKVENKEDHEERGTRKGPGSG